MVFPMEVFFLGGEDGPYSSISLCPTYALVYLFYGEFHHATLVWPSSLRDWSEGLNQSFLLKGSCPTRGNASHPVHSLRL